MNNDINDAFGILDTFMQNNTSKNYEKLENTEKIFVNLQENEDISINNNNKYDNIDETNRKNYNNQTNNNNLNNTNNINNSKAKDDIFAEMDNIQNTISKIKKLKSALSGNPIAIIELLDKDHKMSKQLQILKTLPNLMRALGNDNEKSNFDTTKNTSSNNQNNFDSIQDNFNYYDKQIEYNKNVNNKNIFDNIFTQKESKTYKKFNNENTKPSVNSSFEQIISFKTKKEWKSLFYFWH